MSTTSRRYYPDELHAEEALGFVAGDNSITAGRLNTQLFNSMCEAMCPRPNKYFTFTNGLSGPIVSPVRFPGKEFFFYGTPQTAVMVGGVILGSGGRAFPQSSLEMSSTGTYAGSNTVFTRIDGENGGAVLRLRGSGMTIGGISFRGGYLPTGIVYTGAKTPVGIEIEGRSYPGTGQHTIFDCAIEHCTSGIVFQPGYYDTDGLTLLPQEEHADNCSWYNMNFWNCDSCVKSKNQQAVNHTFMGTTRATSISGDDPTIVLDIERGGNVHILGALDLGQRKTTLIKTKDYSPNNSQITIRYFRWDRADSGADAYLRLYHYNGYVDANVDMSGFKWSVQCEGAIAYGAPNYDESQHIIIDDGSASVPLDRSDLLFHVHGMNMDGFLIQGDGPWYIPDNP